MKSYDFKKRMDIRRERNFQRTKRILTSSALVTVVGVGAASNVYAEEPEHTEQEQVVIQDENTPKESLEYVNEANQGAGALEQVERVISESDSEEEVNETEIDGAADTKELDASIEVETVIEEEEQEEKKTNPQVEGLAVLPQAPYVDKLMPDDLIIRGFGEVGAEVFAVINGEKSAPVSTDKNGYFEIELAAPLLPGTMVEVFQQNTAGISVPATIEINKSTQKEPEVDTDLNFSVAELYENDLYLSGTGKPGAIIHIMAFNGEIARGIVEEDGNYHIELKALLGEGTQVEIFHEDKETDESSSAQITVKGVEDEIFDNIHVNSISNEDGAITGTAQPGALIYALVDEEEIGWTLVDSSGNFSIGLLNSLMVGTEVEIFQTNRRWSSSSSYSIVEESSAYQFTVSPVYDTMQYLHGQAQPGATIRVLINGEELTSEIVQEHGYYDIWIYDPLEIDTEIELRQEVDGNEPKSIFVTVEEDFRLSIPQVFGGDSSISGSAKPNTTIYAQIDGKVIGEANVDSKGKFVLHLEKPLPTGTNIEVYQVKDEIIEALTYLQAEEYSLYVNEINEVSNVIDGISRSGSILLLTVDGQEKTVIADKNGYFQFRLNNPPTVGSKVHIIETYQGRNVSNLTFSVGSFDIFDVEQLLDDSYRIEGVGRPGSKVEARVNGEIIGSSIIDSNTLFTILLKSPLPTSTKVTLEMTTKAGDVKSEIVVVEESEATIEIDDSIIELDYSVRGMARPGVMVYALLDGKIAGRDWTGDRRRFNIDFSATLAAGSNIEVYYIDPNGQRISDSAIVKGQKKPEVYSISDQDKSIFGRAPSHSKVIAKVDGKVIAQAITDSYSSFWIHLKDNLPAGTKVEIYYVKDSKQSGSNFIRVEKEENRQEYALPFEIHELYDYYSHISGVGSIGNTVYAIANGEEIGQIKLTEHNYYYFEMLLDQTLSAGTKVEVFQVDDRGRKDDSIYLTVKRRVLPEVEQILDDEQVIRGIGNPNSLVFVLVNEEIIGNAKVQSDGIFEISLDMPLPLGTLVEFYQQDGTKQSESQYIRVDLSDSPIRIHDVDWYQSLIRGYGRAGAVIEVSAHNKVIGTTVVEQDRSFEVKLNQPITFEMDMELYQKDGKEVIGYSIIDISHYSPSVNLISKRFIEGSGMPGSRIVAKINEIVIAEGDISEYGYFRLDFNPNVIDQYEKNDQIYLYTEGGNQVSQPRIIQLAELYKRPSLAYFKRNIYNTDTKYYIGATTGSTVYVEADGKIIKTIEVEEGEEVGDETRFYITWDNPFPVGTILKFYAIDGEQQSMVNEFEVLEAPTSRPLIINPVFINEYVVFSGTGTPGRHVIIQTPEFRTGAVINDDGTFETSIWGMDAGEVVTIYDAFDSVSTEPYGKIQHILVQGKPVTPDGEKTPQPEVEGTILSEESSIIKGKAFKGSYVYALVDGNVIGSVLVGGDTEPDDLDPDTLPKLPSQQMSSSLMSMKMLSLMTVTTTSEDDLENYTIDLDVKLTAGTSIAVTQIDKNGVQSESKIIKVKAEKTGAETLATPTVNKVVEGASEIKGHGAEAGSIVQVEINQEVIGVGKADQNGEFTIDVDGSLLRVGVEIIILQLDEARNFSPDATVKVVADQKEEEPDDGSGNPDDSNPGGDSDDDSGEEPDTGEDTGSDDEGNEESHSDKDDTDPTPEGDGGDSGSDDEQDTGVETNPDPGTEPKDPLPGNEQDNGDGDDDSGENEEPGSEDPGQGEPGSDEDESGSKDEPGQYDDITPDPGTGPGDNEESDEDAQPDQEEEPDNGGGTPEPEDDEAKDSEPVPGENDKETEEETGDSSEDDGHQPSPDEDEEARDDFGNSDEGEAGNGEADTGSDEEESGTDKEPGSGETPGTGTDTDDSDKETDTEQPDGNPVPTPNPDKENPQPEQPVKQDTDIEGDFLNGYVISGTAEPGTIIRVYNGKGEEILSVTVDATGRYSITLTAADVEELDTLTVTATDSAGNESVVNKVTVPFTILDAPEIGEVKSNDSTITGRAYIGAEILAYVNGEVVGKAIAVPRAIVVAELNNVEVASINSPAQALGYFTIELNQPLPAGTEITLMQVFNGKTSELSTIVVQAADEPAEDPVLVAHAVTEGDRTIEGTGTAGNKVTATVKGKKIGEAVVGADGKFSIELAERLAAGTEVELNETDAEGNHSGTTSIVVSPQDDAPSDEEDKSSTEKETASEKGSNTATSTESNSTSNKQSSSNSSTGQKLPKTATAAGGIGLAGAGALIAGLFARFVARRKEED